MVVSLSTSLGIRIDLDIAHSRCPFGWLWKFLWLRKINAPIPRTPLGYEDKILQADTCILNPGLFVNPFR